MERESARAQDSVCALATLAVLERVCACVLGEWASAGVPTAGDEWTERFPARSSERELGVIIRLNSRPLSTSTTIITHRPLSPARPQSLRNNHELDDPCLSTTTTHHTIFHHGECHRYTAHSSSTQHLATTCRCLGRSADALPEMITLAGSQVEQNRPSGSASRTAMAAFGAAALGYTGLYHATPPRCGCCPYPQERDWDTAGLGSHFHLLKHCADLVS